MSCQKLLLLLRNPGKRGFSGGAAATVGRVGSSCFASGSEMLAVNHKWGASVVLVLSPALGNPMRASGWALGERDAGGYGPLAGSPFLLLYALHQKILTAEAHEK